MLSPEELHALFEQVPDGVFVHDETGRILQANAQACADLGYARADLLGMDIGQVLRSAAPADDAARWAQMQAGAAATHLQTAVRQDGATFAVEVRLACRVVQGRRLFVGVARAVGDRVATVQQDTAQRVAGLTRAHLQHRMARQVAELRAREHEIGQQHGRLVLAARVGGLGIWDYDLVGDVLECDAQWYRIMGRDPREPVRSIAAFRAFVHPQDVDRATNVELTVAQLVATGQDYGIGFRILRPDGEVRHVRSAGCLIDDLDGRPRRAVGFVTDVTEAWLAEERLRLRSEELERRALEDPLTGVANRRCLDQELERARLHGLRTGTPVSLAMVDVDFFKLYNDRYGHLQGDEALKRLAAVLSASVRRPYDLVARYGGEEFAILLPGEDQPERVLRKIADALAQSPMPHAASPIGPHLTISCGCVVVSRLESLSARDLLASSDEALYRAKDQGRNCIVTMRL